MFEEKIQNSLFIMAYLKTTKILKTKFKKGYTFKIQRNNN